MPQESIVTSPLDTRYTAHREAEHRREKTREWLKQRERELSLVRDAPSVASAQPNKWPEAVAPR
jgi:hypothetical protein